MVLLEQARRIRSEEESDHTMSDDKKTEAQVTWWADDDTHCQLEVLCVTGPAVGEDYRREGTPADLAAAIKAMPSAQRTLLLIEVVEDSSALGQLRGQLTEAVAKLEAAEGRVRELESELSGAKSMLSVVRNHMVRVDDAWERWQRGDLSTEEFSGTVAELGYQRDKKPAPEAAKPAGPAPEGVKVERPELPNGVLSTEDHEAFQQLLNAPAKIVPALAKAMRERRKHLAASPLSQVAQGAETMCPEPDCTHAAGHDGNHTELASPPTEAARPAERSVPRCGQFGCIAGAGHGGSCPVLPFVAGPASPPPQAADSAPTQDELQAAFEGYVNDHLDDFNGEPAARLWELLTFASGLRSQAAKPVAWQELRRQYENELVSLRQQLKELTHCDPSQAAEPPSPRLERHFREMGLEPAHAEPAVSGRLSWPGGSEGVVCIVPKYLVDAPDGPCRATAGDLVELGWVPKTQQPAQAAAGPEHAAGEPWVPKVTDVVRFTDTKPDAQWYEVLEVDAGDRTARVRCLDSGHGGGGWACWDDLELAPKKSPNPQLPRTDGPAVLTVQMMVVAARRASHRGRGYLRDDGQNALLALADELERVQKGGGQ